MKYLKNLKIFDGQLEIMPMKHNDVDNYIDDNDTSSAELELALIEAINREEKISVLLKSVLARIERDFVVGTPDWKRYVPADVTTFWKDSKISAEEKKARELKRKRDFALAKLTDEDKKILGLL